MVYLKTRTNCPYNSDRKTNRQRENKQADTQATDAHTSEKKEEEKNTKGHANKIILNVDT